MGPSRVNEVLASPTTSVSTADDLRSPALREHGASSNIPFEIPLEPIYKNHRSQSYSAGQLERDNMLPYGGLMKTRTGLANRPSRPSMLNDGARDALASLREDEDDLESSNGSEQGVRLAAASRNDYGSKQSVYLVLFPVGSQCITASTYPSNLRPQQRRAASVRSPDSDYAVEEYDEVAETTSERGRAAPRNAAISSSSTAGTLPAIVNQRLEGLKRSQPGWQSHLGFDVPDEDSQSRRHSFAVADRGRNGSLSQTPEAQYGGQYNGQVAGPVIMASHGNGRAGHPQHAIGEDRKFDHLVTNPQALHAMQFRRTTHQEERRMSEKGSNDKQFAAAYFSGAETHRRHLRDTTEEYNPFQVPSVYARPGRVLYIVSFKCKRSDIFYIPDNTGLAVKAGDTVIVEGDRGQDLGTVEVTNVTMEQAKKSKEDFSKLHFKCLMMFSRFYPHIATLANNDEAFNEAMGKHAAGAAGAAVAMAPFEPEPRPKMIKRVAKPDEVHLLREKEGNEAKAKRVCQNKVSEHNLRMEILDAEFQQ